MQPRAHKSDDQRYKVVELQRRKVSAWQERYLLKSLNLKDQTLSSLSSSDAELLLKLKRQAASRREFITMLVSAGASVAASNAIFSNIASAADKTPRRGGKLIMAADQHGPDDTLDPALASSSADYFRLRMFYGSLTRLTADLNYEPELAEEINSNEDATVWTFKIRRGVEFHDGKLLTADDVVYSMNRHIGSDSISKASALVAMVDRWEKVNKFEVRAVLNSPSIDLPIILGTFHFKIIKDGTTNFQTAIGTGPYRVKEFKPGVRAIGSSFENFWTAGGYLDELEHYAIGDSVSRLNAFMAGNVDAMVNLPPQAIKFVDAAEGKELWTLKSGSYTSIVPRLDLAESSNLHLYKAMQALQDRQRLVKGILKGRGSLGNDQPINEAYSDYCPDIPQRELDPDKAKYHWARSGIGSTPVPVICSDFAPGAVEQCLFMQREGHKIGANFKVRKVATEGYWGAVWLKAPIFAAGWNMRPTANVMMTLTFKSDSAWNESRWKNDKFDQTLVAVRGVIDPMKRKQMYCDLQTMIHEENGMSIPVHRDFIDAAASHVKGRTSVPLNNFGGAECPVTLWRDDG